MSNSRVRKELEQQEMLAQASAAANKIYEKYKAKEDLLTNYQMVKGFYNDSGANISNLVERILKEKYNLPWQEKLIRRALSNVKGQRDAVVSIPQFKYEEKVYDILSKFVKKKFNRMVAEVMKHKTGTLYPLSFRDLIEKYS